MRIARSQAAPGDVVLLSTGCASYGEFNNFQERGELFAELARGQG
jgi:UDP-N-acetylmuramoylalanine--D-glutamate ligase